MIEAKDDYKTKDDYELQAIIDVGSKDSPFRIAALKEQLRRKNAYEGSMHSMTKIILWLTAIGVVLMVGSIVIPFIK